MADGKQISTLFLDIGGVLLTNGWDRNARTLAAENFSLDFHDLDERHHLTYDTYEAGKISLDEYLNRIVFYQPRSFTREEFKNFVFQYSQPYPEMLTLVRRLKSKYQLKTVAVSNEGRELTEYRIQKYNLGEIIDFFVSSCFVHLRKPDIEIYKLALDISQTSVVQVVYLDDRSMFTEVAKGLGIHTVLHRDASSTQSALADLGLT
jgi:putative hydrolase of the HAD superfamily